MKALKRGLTKVRSGESSGGPIGCRKAVAHFMLGNTWQWDEQDWEETFALAQDTHLDGFALNLGSEEWQYQGAELALDILSRPSAEGSSRSSKEFKAFLSLDMNVLSCATPEDAERLLEMVASLMGKEGYMRFKGGALLSTFGGHDAEMGGLGWKGWLEKLSEKLKEKVFFMPAFFMPPKDFLALPYVDGTFDWNSAWPRGNHSNNTVEEEPFLDSNKPYMAAVSPLFFTHYGSTGQWAFHKNFIYRFDDLLYPWRWHTLLALPPERSPDLIQVISWNDHGESHHISPVRRNEPGSEAWTRDMPHEAFREMTRYFIGRWRDGKGEADEVSGPGGDGSASGIVRVWAWYRCQSKDIEVSKEDDPVGKPDHAEWAQDLLNFLIVTPETPTPCAFHLVIHNGSGSESESAPQRRHLESGKANMSTVPFVPGPVRFEVIKGSDCIVVSGEGREIAPQAQVRMHNYNMWSGSWCGDVQVAGNGEAQGQGGGGPGGSGSKIWRTLSGTRSHHTA